MRRLFEEYVVKSETVTDNDWHTIVESSLLGTLEGWIDLSAMQAGDSVTIEESVKIKAGGTYRIYDSAPYTGVQTKPALHMVKLPAKHGIRVRLQQTAPAPPPPFTRTYDCDFFRRRLV